jgi:hypothetical protein
MRVFRPYDALSLIGKFEGHLRSLPHYVHRRFRPRDIRLEGTLPQLQILTLDSLLLQLRLTLHVVDKEQLLYAVPGLLWRDVDLLRLEEGLELLTGLFSKR